MRSRSNLRSSISKVSNGKSQPAPASAAKSPDAAAATNGKLVDAEKSETGKVQLKVYMYYMKAVGVFLAVLTFALYVSAQAFSVGSNIWLARWTDDVSAFNDTSKRDLYLGVYGALGLGQAIFSLFAGLFLSVVTLSAAGTIHANALACVLRYPLSFFDVTPSGRTVNRFSKDVDALDNTLPQNVRSWIYCFQFVLGTFFAISYATPIFILVILPVLGFYYFMQLVYVATSRQLKRYESVSRSPIYSHFSETITGATTIRAFNKSNDFILQSEEKLNENQICYYPSMVANRWLAFRLDMVGTIITCAAALLAVLARGDIDEGLVGMSVSYAMQVTQTLNWLVRMSSDVETNIVAVERIREYSELEQEADWYVREDGDGSSEPAGPEHASNSGVVRRRKGPPADWPDVGRVEFAGYETRYRPGLDLVLRGITTVVNGGEKVGIVGRTGAGKSSLTMALFRILEAASGSIIVDGVRLSDIGLHDVRGRFTIIPQDPVLFSGSLRYNLDPFDKYSDDQLWRSLQLSHLHQFVHQLPAGLQHEVNEGGSNLSVGQRQLVCLARALLRKSRVLVLDEATAALDLETDNLIQSTIRSEFVECTVLTIAHRLNTIMDNDRVMVLSAGSIVEYAPPSELLADTSSVFYGMAKSAGVI